MTPALRDQCSELLQQNAAWVHSVRVCVHVCVHEKNASLHVMLSCAETFVGLQKMPVAHYISSWFRVLSEFVISSTQESRTEPPPLNQLDVKKSLREVQQVAIDKFSLSWHLKKVQMRKAIRTVRCKSNTTRTYFRPSKYYMYCLRYTVM